MVEKTDYRGVVQGLPSIPEAEQRELIAKYEPSEVYVLGKVTQADIARQQREPRAIIVSDAALCGEQKGTKDPRFDSFLWFKNEIHRRGGWIEEARTGRRSDKKKDWPLMRRDAERMCGRLAKGLKSAFNAKKGKKPWTATKETKDAIREEWYVRPARVVNGVLHPRRTVDHAVAAIKTRLGKKAPGRTVLYREFGDPVMKKR